MKSRRQFPAVKLFEVLILTGVLLTLLSCGGGRRRPREVNLRPGEHWSQEGNASWYGKKFNGKPTASGEIFDMYAMTAAHRTLPLGTRIRVKNLENGKTIEVKVNDRGPFVRGRILDCSYGAAKKLGYANAGITRVKIEVISKGSERRRASRAEEALLVGEGSNASLLDGSFTVQAGAFVEKSNALRFRERLKKEYGTAYVIRFREFYRVRVGHLPDEASAEELLEKMADNGLDGFVTRND